MGNKKNSRKKAPSKTRTIKHRLAKQKETDQAGSAGTAHYTPKDRQLHKAHLRTKELAAWQETLLDKKIIARNWKVLEIDGRSRKEVRRFHLDFRNEFSYFLVSIISSRCN